MSKSPPAPPKDPASANLQIRLPPAEKQAFIDAAARAGWDLTTWVRLALRRAAGLDR